MEDESQREFLTGVARTLGFDLDALSLSVIPVNGDRGYAPFQTLLDALSIPYVCLKDKSWGQGVQFPRDRFFSLKAEIEDYLDARGLADKRKEVIQDVGKSKPRVMAELATRLTKKDIPVVFKQLLSAAQRLASPA